MKYFFLFAAAILGISSTQHSCTPKEQAVITNVSKEDLQGKWKWILSRMERRGSGTTEITPAEVGISMEVEFKQDGKLHIYHNGKLVSTNAYELTTPGSDEQSMLRVESTDPAISPNCESGPLYLQGKKLTISGGYNDAGSNQFFEKIN